MQASTSAADIPIEDGPQIWRLWRAERAGVPSLSGWESLLYTDAHPVGDATEGLGPFQMIPTMTDFMNDSFAPRLALRIHWRDAGQAPERSKTRIRKEGSRWLALNIENEIACLLSLIFGLRVRSGGKVRSFSAEDPLGRPTLAEHSAPTPLDPAWTVPMLPDLAGVRFPLRESARFLSRYPELEPQQAVVLVRAARHYATALWVADNDPEQAWLQLVSALEAAATYWNATTVDPIDLFTDAFPDPARILRETGDDELIAKIASHFTKLIGAGRRLEDFIERFKSKPPCERPPVGVVRNLWDDSGNIMPISAETVSTVETQVDWNNLRPTIKKIYKHRSELLHNGTPFPAALCFPPTPIDGKPTERPIGSESYADNTTWTAEDTPIHLHTFAHLVRGTLLNWWTECTSADGIGSTPANA